MNEWINNCNKEELSKVIQAEKRIDNNHKRMKDSTILKKLINGKIALYQIFEFIKDPPEEVQLAAVKQNSFDIEYGEVNYNIKYIKNPSEEVKLAAVKQNGYAVQFIKNPSEEVQLAAVMENGCAIEYINEPSEQVQLAAVKKFGVAIGHIKNPSEEIKLAAVKQSCHAIHHIKNPSKEAMTIFYQHMKQTYSSTFMWIHHQEKT
jgi:hypothetical protein